MMKKNLNLSVALSALLIVFTVIMRVVFSEVMLFNIAPVIAISLFSGGIMKNKSYAYLVPLAVYLLSDIYMQIAHGTGFYGVSQFFVYMGMALVVALGTRMKKINTVSVLGYSIGGSLLFWLVSNLGVFAQGYYGYSVAGLVETFAWAIPFYKNEMSTQLFFNPIISNVITSGLLFASYAMVASKWKTSKVAA
jgi:hypothetical protein